MEPTVIEQLSSGAVNFKKGLFKASLFYQFYLISSMIARAVVLADLSTDPTKLNQKLIQWLELSLIVDSIHFFLVLHTMLRYLWPIFQLRKQFLKRLKICLFAITHTTHLSLVILAFNLIAQIKSALNLTYDILLAVIYLKIGFLSIFWLIMLVGFCFFCGIAFYHIQQDSHSQRSTDNTIISRYSMVSRFNELLGIDDTCYICCEQYDQNELVRTLNCGHAYHKSCIDEWFKRSNLCPSCKQPIDTAHNLHKV